MTPKVAEKKSAPIVKYETERGDVSLSVEFVRNYFCATATPYEAFAFIQLCRFHRLNPYLREAYLVKYGQNDPAQFIIGYQSWTQRAERDPNYQGFKAGLILSKKEEEGELRHREGTFYQQEEVLLGGWCEVKRSDRPDPVRIEVALHEYIQKTREGRPNRFWGEKPGTMIRKVAIAQAHREAYPSLFAGLFDQSELNADNDLPTDVVIVEGSSTWLAEPAAEPQEEPAAPKPKTPRAAQSDKVCQIHQKRWGANVEGVIGHPIEGGGWCEKGADSGDTEETASAEAKAPATVAALQNALDEAGWNWDGFQLQVLGTSWEMFTTKEGGSVASAWAKYLEHEGDDII